MTTEVKPRKPREGRKYLNAKEIKLLDGVMAGKDPEQAALDAGFPPKSAAARASQILNSAKGLAELALRRRSLAEKTDLYNVPLAVKDLDVAIDLSLKAGNIANYMRAIELKAKLSGLMVERIDARVGTFSINISGIDETQGKRAEPIDIQGLVEVEVQSAPHDPVGNAFQRLLE